MEILVLEEKSKFQLYGDEMKKVQIEPTKLKPPQQDALEFIQQWFENGVDRVCTIVLPTGCGKSGVAVFTPYFLKSKKTMVVSPSK